MQYGKVLIQYMFIGKSSFSKSTFYNLQGAPGSGSVKNGSLNCCFILTVVFYILEKISMIRI